jgi:hypothetical protein
MIWLGGRSTRRPPLPLVCRSTPTSLSFLQRKSAQAATKAWAAADASDDDSSIDIAAATKKSAPIKQNKKKDSETPATPAKTAKQRASDTPDKPQLTYQEINDILGRTLQRPASITGTPTTLSDIISDNIPCGDEKYKVNTT